MSLTIFFISCRSVAAAMDSLLTEVKPMRIPRPKFCCSKPSLVYPAEPPKDYLDLEVGLEQLAKSQKSSSAKVEELGRTLQEKVKV